MTHELLSNPPGRRRKATRRRWSRRPLPTHSVPRGLGASVERPPFPAWRASAPSLFSAPLPSSPSSSGSEPRARPPPLGLAARWGRSSLIVRAVAVAGLRGRALCSRPILPSGFALVAVFIPMIL
ncbi:hypothetical protein VPH35_024546 [Triticum aestivum]